MTADTAMTVYEPARAVDVVHRVPVLVVGGGPSGLAGRSTNSTPASSRPSWTGREFVTGKAVKCMIAAFRE